MLFARQSSGLEAEEEENWGDQGLTAVREWTLQSKIPYGAFALC